MLAATSNEARRVNEVFILVGSRAAYALWDASEATTLTYIPCEAAYVSPSSWVGPPCVREVDAHGREFRIVRRIETLRYVRNRRQLTLLKSESKSAKGARGQPALRSIASRRDVPVTNM